MRSALDLLTHSLLLEHHRHESEVAKVPTHSLQSECFVQLDEFDARLEMIPTRREKRVIRLDDIR